MMSSRNIGADLLRIIASYCVVLIHTPAHGEESVLKWLVLGILPSANISFALMAGFFMLRGFDHKFCRPGKGGMLFLYMPVREWLAGRMSRIVSPFVVWSLVYVALNIFFDTLRHQPQTFDLCRLDHWITIFLKGGGSTQLWFIPALFYSQLLLAAVYAVFWRLKFSRVVLLSVLLTVGLIAMFGHRFLQEGHYLRSFVFVFGYVFLGAFLGGSGGLERWVRWGSILSIAGILVYVGECLFIGNVTTGWKYFYPFCWLYWTCLRNFTWEVRLGRFVSDLGQTAMGIYFVHMIPVTLFPFVCRLCGITVDFSLFPVVMAFVYCVLSWGIVKILSRIQGTRIILV